MRHKILLAMALPAIVMIMIMPVANAVSVVMEPVVATEDALIDEDSGDYNSGDSWIATGWKNIFFVMYHERILVKFQFGTPLENVTSVDIALYLEVWLPLGTITGKQFAFDVYLVGDSWSESSVTWNTKPSIIQQVGNDVAGFRESSATKMVHVIFDPGDVLEGKSTISLMIYLDDKGADYMDWFSCASTELGSFPPTMKVTYDDGTKPFNFFEWIWGLIAGFISFILGFFGITLLVYKKQKKACETNPKSPGCTVK